MKRLPRAISDSGPERAHLLQLPAAPDTPPERLVTLSRLSNPELNARIAANPNAPKKTLYALWRIHPLFALENLILLDWSLRDGSPCHELLPCGVKLPLCVALRKTGATKKIEEHLPLEERRNLCGQPDTWIECDSASQVTATGRRKRPNAAAGINAIGLAASEAPRLLAEDPSAKVRQKMAKAIEDMPIGREQAMRLQERLAQDTCVEVRAGLAASRLISPELHHPKQGEEVPGARESGMAPLIEFGILVS